jgi:hypothetical protein
MSSERAEIVNQDKVRRVPFGGARQRLQLDDLDQKRFEQAGFVPRWFNDEHGRVERALAAGYIYVDPKEVPSLGHGVITEGNTDVGSRVSKVVNKGDPQVRAFLMKIKKEYWLEDQAAKEQVNQKVDEALAVGGKRKEGIENEYKPR